MYRLLLLVLLVHPQYLWFPPPLYAYTFTLCPVFQPSAIGNAGSLTNTTLNLWLNSGLHWHQYNTRARLTSIHFAFCHRGLKTHVFNTSCRRCMITWPISESARVHSATEIVALYIWRAHQSIYDRGHGMHFRPTVIPQRHDGTLGGRTKRCEQGELWVLRDHARDAGVVDFHRGVNMKKCRGSLDCGDGYISVRRNWRIAYIWIDFEREVVECYVE